MARKRPSPPPAAPVSLARAVRLYQLVRLLSRPQTRDRLLNKLGVEIRGFYRDLETLRQAGVEVVLHEGRYSLLLPHDEALSLLPLPDPCLTLGEAQILVQERIGPHKKLAHALAAVRGRAK